MAGVEAMLRFAIAVARISLNRAHKRVLIRQGSTKTQKTDCDTEVISNILHGDPGDADVWYNDGGKGAESSVIS